MAFQVENIPDQDRLFRRIASLHYNAADGKISSAAFKNEQMSVDWEKYSTPAASANSGSVLVVALVAQGCRSLGQIVNHTPIESEQPHGPNQAHAEISGKKTNAIAHHLRDMAETVWRSDSIAG